MDTLARAAGFIVVYPNGTGFLPNRLLTSNAGTCCGSAAANNIDDVGFTLALLDKIERLTAVDANSLIWQFFRRHPLPR